jgi:hypothetical protein
MPSEHCVYSAVQSAAAVVRTLRNGERDMRTSGADEKPRK